MKRRVGIELPAGNEELAVCRRRMQHHRCQGGGGGRTRTYPGLPGTRHESLVHSPHSVASVVVVRGILDWGQLHTAEGIVHGT